MAVRLVFKAQKQVNSFKVQNILKHLKSGNESIVDLCRVIKRKKLLFVCQYQNQSSVVESWKLKCRFVKMQRPVERGAQRWACPDTVACGFTFFPQTPPQGFERIDLSNLTSGLSLIPAPLGLPLSHEDVLTSPSLFFCLQT